MGQLPDGHHDVRTWLWHGVRSQGKPRIKTTGRRERESHGRIAAGCVGDLHDIDCAPYRGDGLGCFFSLERRFANQSLSFYFSLNEYTTVGSNFDLPLRWRLLEGMIATAGLIAFAWSTAVLITLAQQFQNQQMEMFQKRHQKKVKS